MRCRDLAKCWQVAPLMEKVKAAQATTDAAKLQLREVPTKDAQRTFKERGFLYTRWRSGWRLLRPSVFCDSLAVLLLTTSILVP